jgi:small-conductance mechanosensitive channel
MARAGSRFAYFLGVFSVLMMTFALTGIQIADANGDIPVDILEIDIYQKTIGPQESMTYNWTLNNTHATSNYSVRIFKSESETGWTVNFNQDIVTLTPQSTWDVIMTVTPPADLERGELTVSPRFEITNATGGWNISVSTVTTKVYSLPQVLGLFDNPLPAPLDGKYGVFLLDVLLWTLIIIIAYVAFERGIKHWTKRTKTQLDDIIFRIIRTPILVLLILYGLVTSVEVLDVHRDIIRVIDQIYFIVILLVVLWLAFRLFKDILIYYGRIYSERTKTEIDDVLIPVADKIGVVIIIVAGIAILMGYLGVDLTMLAVGSIVISMVIAFALQDTLSNFFSGIYLLTDRPFKVGDLIKLESGEVCRIEHIGMRATRVYNTFDHTLIVVPNNMLANNKIVNYTEPDTQFRTTAKVGVAYGTDVQKVTEILYEIANAHPKVLKKPDQYKPSVRFKEFGDSSLNFELWVWIDNVFDRFDVMTNINMEIDRRFKEEKITIPFPQRTVWMHETK